MFAHVFRGSCRYLMLLYNNRLRCLPQDLLSIGVNLAFLLGGRLLRQVPHLKDKALRRVKLTLGELKQISEGLVIDVGSVYDNKIKLRVENQVVATGELVILNDRYGVRIENVKKNKEEAPKATPKKAVAQTPAVQPTGKAAPKKTKPAPDKEGDENFDYSDFEIEDESI